MVWGYCLWDWEQVGELVVTRSVLGPSCSFVLLPGVGRVDKLVLEQLHSGGAEEGGSRLPSGLVSVLRPPVPRHAQETRRAGFSHADIRDHSQKKH